MSFEDLVQSLQKEYLESLPEKIARIKIQIEASDAGNLRESFHKLKGTGRTYGLPEVSELAELTEKICVAQPKIAGEAATAAVGLLHDIHAAHTAAKTFQLHSDSRFQQLRKLLPA